VNKSFLKDIHIKYDPPYPKENEIMIEKGMLAECEKNIGNKKGIRSNI